MLVLLDIAEYFHDFDLLVDIAFGTKPSSDYEKIYQ